MKTHHWKPASILFASFVLLSVGSCQNQKRQEPDETKPIVALVQRTNGRLVIKIDPDPSPGKDALYVLSALHERFGPTRPVVAIVDDTSKIMDLYQVDGIAAKAGFEKVRTFISHRDNGMMFEVKFGAAVPFSIAGPFDAPTKPPKE